MSGCGGWPAVRWRSAVPVALLLLAAFMWLREEPGSVRGAARPSSSAGAAPGAGGDSGAGPWLVHVLLGDPHFQFYTLEALKQARLHNPHVRMALVVTPDLFNAARPEWLAAADALAVNVVDYGRLQSDWSVDAMRGYAGMWATLQRRVGFMLPTVNDKMNFAFTQFTMERLWALHGLMASYRLADVVHVENDQMLYGDVAAVVAAARTCGVRLAMTRIGKRMAPAVVYAANASALGELLTFMADAIKSGPDAASALVGTGWVTDMTLTAAFFDLHRRRVAAGGPEAAASAGITSLPNRGNDGSCMARETGGLVFDAAPLGHWCCGTFEKPKEHFTHRDGESEVAYWDRPFDWTMVPPPAGSGKRVWPRGAAAPDALRVPTWDGNRVFNLHIHSKQLEPWKS
jgi:hypothetical protein